MYKDGIKIVCPKQITGCLRESTWHTTNWRQAPKTSVVKAGMEPFPSPLACCS